MTNFDLFAALEGEGLLFSGEGLRDVVEELIFLEVIARITSPCFLRGEAPPDFYFQQVCLGCFIF